MGTTQPELHHFDLNQKLPADAAMGGNSVWSRYRQYPVFSRPWLHARSLVFCSSIAALTIFGGVLSGIFSRTVWIGVVFTVAQFAGLAFIACAGPALATYVRHRGLPARHARTWISVAILGCMALGWPVLQFANGIVADLMPPQSAEPPAAPLDLDASERVLSITLNALGALLFNGLLGGGLALRAYFTEQDRWLEHHQRKKLEAARAQAHEADLRLGVLQAQVEPHFLFNTLASIRVLIVRDPDRAAATLDALVAFLRATIPQFRDPTATHATLGEQLEVCRSYLQVMQIRMAERLRYTIDADPQLLDTAFPPAILITLVENAVKHGIEPKPGPGLIEVRACVQAGHLLVQVLDNGAGLKPGLGRGVGLANVREQLSSRFGAYAQVRLYSLADQRTCAEVSVPRSLSGSDKLLT